MSGFISNIYPILVSAGGAAVGGAALYQSSLTGATETDAMGIDFTYHTDVTKQMSVLTSSVAVDTAPYSTLTYTSPSIKMTRQSDGVWRYANHNYCLRSAEFSNATWTKTGATITADQANGPDGSTNTADLFTGLIGGGVNTVYESAVDTIPAGVNYSISVFAKAGTGQYLILGQGDGTNSYAAVFDLSGVSVTETGTAGDGTHVSSSITSVGSGWYKLVVTGTYTAAHAGVLRHITATNVGTGNVIDGYGRDASTVMAGETYYLWGFQAKRTPVNDAGGYTYATGYLATTSAAVYDLPYEWSAALVSQGILIEEARTNIATNSQTLSGWTSENVSGTVSSTTAPDGTSTTAGVREDTQANVHGIYLSVTITAAATTWSAFIKSFGGRGWARINAYDGSDHFTYFDIVSGAVGTNAAGNTASIVDAGNGWWRCIVTRTAGGTGGYIVVGGASADNTGNYVGDNAKGIYIWGAQVETGAFATSPIHTIAATVTRATDNISLLTSAIPFSATVGTLVANVISQSVVGTHAGPTITNGGYTESFLLRHQDAGARFDIFVGAASQLNLNDSPIVAGVAYKNAGAYASGDFDFCFNGGTVQSDAGGTLPTVTAVNMGGLGGGDQNLNGYLKQITYLKRHATDGQLQGLTA